MAKPKPLYDDESKMDSLGVGTKLIALTLKDDHSKSRPVVTPIYQTSIYYGDSAETFEDQISSGLIYNRIRNPNTDEVEMTIAQIEHGQGALVFPSGMAAIVNTLMCFLKPGDHIVVQTPLYSCSSYLLENIFSQYKIEVSYLDGTQGMEEYRKEIRKNTTILYGEAIGNPSMRFLDVKKLAEIGKEFNVMTIIDGTFAPPINLTPLVYGIDVVVHSCTKYMGGHSDMLAGCAAFNNLDHYSKARTWRTFTGSNQSAFDSVLLMRSLRTLHVRMERHNQNGLAVAKYLERHRLIKKVYYIGLESNPQHALAASMMKGFGGMMSVELETKAKAVKFAESTRIFRLAVSLGGAESLIEHVVTMTHNNTLSSKQGKKGVPDTMVRLSVGIEDINDQIADLEQALQKSEEV